MNEYTVRAGWRGTFKVIARTRMEAIAVVLAQLVREDRSFDARQVVTWSAEREAK